MALSSEDVATKPAIVCKGSQTAQAVAQAMAEGGVGCVVIVDDEQRPVGIVTDRDLAVRIVAQGRPGSTEIQLVMTREVATVIESASPLTAAREMERLRCRHIPVVSDAYGHVLGVVAADDLLRLESEELEAIAHSTAEATSAREVRANLLSR